MSGRIILSNFLQHTNFLKDSLPHLEIGNSRVKWRLTWKISQENSTKQLTFTSIALFTMKPTIIATNNIFTWFLVFWDIYIRIDQRCIEQ